MDETNKAGLKTTELWMATATALVDTILASTAPSDTTIALIICLSTTTVVYILCRTIFKIARLKYRPDLVTSWTAPKDDNPA